MKKLIIVFSKFIFFVILFYCLLVVVLYTNNIYFFKNNIPNKNQWRSGFTARKLNEIEKIRKTDVLILGSSLAKRNYDTRILIKHGIQSFNLGTSSQKPNMTFVIATEYLKNIKSKLVIIDVNPYLMLTPDNFETTDFIINSKTNTFDWKLFWTAPGIMPLNAIIVKYTGFAEKDRQEKIKDSISDKKDIYFGKGFVSSKLIYNEKDKTPDVNITDFEPLKNQTESLDKMIDFLRSQNINYILILSPINEHYFTVKSKIKGKQFKTLSRAYFSKYDNYIDSNDLEKYDKDDFIDFSHLNETGAKKFTNALMPIIKNKIGK